MCNRQSNYSLVTRLSRIFLEPEVSCFRIAKMAAHLFRFGCFVVLLLGLKQTQGEPFQAPTYTIDLDLAPEERWVNITKKYAEYSAQIMAAIHTRIPACVFPLVEKLAVSMDEHFPEPFPAEMKGVSKGLNLSLADTILLNIFYDLSAFCTSIVAQDKDGNVFHGRNLDYSFSETLRNLTFISNFQSKGKTKTCIRQPCPHFQWPANPTIHPPSPPLLLCSLPFASYYGKFKNVFWADEELRLQQCTVVSD